MELLQDAGARLALRWSVRFFAITVAFVGALGTLARADEPPLPRGAELQGTVETDAIRELPELKGARVNRMRDESISGVRVLDQTYQAPGGYADTVRFYDRALADALLIERDRADTATGWLVRLDDGTVASIVARNTQPATVEIQRLVP